MRVFITGNAGSGKSTAADWLGRQIHLPVFSLDTVVWQKGWRRTPSDLRRELELGLVSQPNWIIEGVSLRVAEAAEVVIFLDVPRPTCLYRVLRRSLPYLFRSRPGLPADCPEWRILPRLASIIWRFPHDVKPKILAVVEHSGGVHIRHPDSARERLARIFNL